jgi:hypothetical protein
LVIKDVQLKELDSALGGVVSELIQLHEFAGKAVSARPFLLPARHCLHRLAVCVPTCVLLLPCRRTSQAAVMQLCSYRQALVLQGSSQSARLGGKARSIALVGLGKAGKAKAVADWGASPFQVRTSCCRR